MAWSVDARIPVTIVGDSAGLAAALAAGPLAAVLAPAPLPPLPAAAVASAGFEATAPHLAGCSCCGGRPPAAAALDRLFQARVRGQCGWFERVVALATTTEAGAALAAAFDQDAVTAARFRRSGA